jgi:3-phosphoshikimate 1-carboxyvinyltransferase
MRRQDTKFPATFRTFVFQVKNRRMQYTILAPPVVRGEINLPASKSISNRALVLNALAGGLPFDSSHSMIENLADCDDTLVMTKALEFGSNQIDIGAAGTSMRFLTAFLAGREGLWEITGSQRMKNRPIRILVDALQSLGADIEYLENDGFPPLKIHGKKLTGGSIDMDGSMSSQYLSAMMMVAPAMRQGLTLNIKGELISKPYIRMTLEMMHQWGIEAEWSDTAIVIRPQNYRAIPFVVESDWSGASYWYQMLSLAEGGEILLKGLFSNSLQGDARVADWFEDLGIRSEYLPEGVRLTKTAQVAERFDADFTNQPDLAQTFAVTCALKGIPFRLTGLQSLRIKETDRISALIKEGAKLGFVFRDSNDSILEWTGESCAMLATAIDTYDDHRMAMAFAPAAVALGIMRINDPQVVSKSYPGFWEDLKSCGFQIDE